MTPPPEKASLQGYRVMVVEDEWLLAMEIKRLLEKQGCTVLGPFGDVPRALASLDGERPDAAILDLNLRGEFDARMAQALEAKGVPFVIVTGYGAAQVTAPEVRNAPRLSKPVDHGKLLRAVRKALKAG